MSGFTFEGQMQAARYAAAAQAAILTGLISPEYLTTRCPECGDEMSVGAPDDHVIGIDREEIQFVIIACEGYWVIPPSLVGIDSPHWSDWTKADN
jgi:plasmid stabilization system protein ParE